MSTDTPVILVAVTGNYTAPETKDLITFYDQETSIPLVLLQEYPDGSRYEGIEWASVIVNSGDKDKGAFRLNALDIIQNHSTMMPIGVIEGNQRYERLWDIPIIKSWSEL